MDAREVLERLCTALEQAEIPFMLAGSFASTVHGVPRTTQDIDVVIDPTPASLEVLAGLFSDAEWYFDRDVARDALRRRSQFNVIDLRTAWKIDFIMRKDRPFSEAEFARRTPALVLGLSIPTATAEDTVVAKLEWAKLAGGSERQLRDIRGVLEVRGAALDKDYVQRWVVQLGLEEEWRQAVESSK